MATGVSCSVPESPSSPAPVELSKDSLPYSTTSDVHNLPGKSSGLTKASLDRARAAQASTGIRRLIVFKGVVMDDRTAVRVGTKFTAEVAEIKDLEFKSRVSRGADNLYGLTLGRSPYPHRTAPTREECEEVHRILTELHGEVVQPDKVPAPSLEVAGCGEVPSVLDALLRTLISGNTLMANADAAVMNLVNHYGLTEHGIGVGSINWEQVRLSPLTELVDTIKPAGCAGIKGAHIKAILDMVHAENAARVNAHINAERTGNSANLAGAEHESRGQVAMEIAKAERNILSLDHMHCMTKDKAMAKFLRYPGIGVKTAACVILFCLRIPCFAVDTHVHKFCQWLGWVPPKASELDSYNHGEFKVPDQLKYGLHQLFIRHGQQCYKCRKATRPGTIEWEEAPDCPLEHLLNRSKAEVAQKATPEYGGVKSKGKRKGTPESSDEEFGGGGMNRSGMDEALADEAMDGDEADDLGHDGQDTDSDYMGYD